LVLVHSDGNSSKNHNNQPLVVEAINAQLRSGDTSITGVMIESNIHAGRQDVPPDGKDALKYGVSITDACIDWETTVTVLRGLNEVRPLCLCFHYPAHSEDSVFTYGLFIFCW
jgi:3-deoxy-7-phosphoheptulonate synthase